MRRSIFWPSIESFQPFMDGEGESGNNASSTTGTSTGESGGTEGTEGQKTESKATSEGKEKTFTQDDVNRIVSDRLKDETKKIAKQVRTDIENEAKAAAAKEQGDYKKLYEQAVEKLNGLEAEKAKREDEDLRKRICREAKLPEDMYKRLVGETEEELKADAKELAKSTKVSDAPDGDQGKTRSKSVAEDKDFEALKKPSAWGLPYGNG